MSNPGKLMYDKAAVIAAFKRLGTKQAVADELSMSGATIGRYVKGVTPDVDNSLARPRSRRPLPQPEANTFTYKVPERPAHPRRHLVIPDTQVRPDVDTSQIEWAAKAIVEYKPDVIIHLGDHWDMKSLSSYEKPGSIHMEGARYENDIASGNDAFERLVAPMEAEMKRDPKWKPRRVFLFGNHENRIHRALCQEPKYAGMVGEHHCVTPGFERHPFLEVVTIDGIRYSHYFSNVNSGKGIGGSIDNRLNRIGESFVQGHEQGFLYGCRQFPTGKTRHGLVAGAFYLHDEDYKGRQGNGHWRGIVVLNEVSDGGYDIMPLSISYLKDRFG